MNKDTVIIPDKNKDEVKYFKRLVVRILVSGFLILVSLLGWLLLETHKTGIIVAEMRVEVRNLKMYVLDKRLRGQEFTKTEAKLLTANIKNWADNRFIKK